MVETYAHFHQSNFIWTVKLRTSITSMSNECFTSKQVHPLQILPYKIINECDFMFYVYPTSELYNSCKDHKYDQPDTICIAYCINYVFAPKRLLCSAPPILGRRVFNQVKGGHISLRRTVGGAAKSNIAFILCLPGTWILGG